MMEEMVKAQTSKLKTKNSKLSVAVRLIALDLDGTIMNGELQIAPRVRTAIREAQARGLHVTLATGRSYSGTSAIAADLGIATPLVLYQGAAVVEAAGGRVLHGATLPRALATEAVALARARGWHVVLYDLDYAYLEQRRLPDEFYARMIHPDVRQVTDLERLPPDGLIKFLVVAEPEAIPPIEAELQTRFAGRATIVRSHPQFVEGNPAGTSKGAGLAWLAGQLGVPREAVLAVGDADNDVSMLTWAGAGVALASGSPAARAAADWVAPSLAEDGAAVAIEKIVLSAQC
jgi:Cof subfamily protein (haloacid dehalogenase superfamily)